MLMLVAGFNGQWRMSRDSALYATIGLNLAEGRGFTHPRGAEGRANPGLPYLLAGVFRVFGPQVLWPALGLMLGCGLAVLGLTYRLFAMHADRGTAAIVTLMLGVCTTFYVHSLDLLTDMPFLLGAMLFLVGYESLRRGGGRWWIDWPTLAAGVAVMAAFRLVVLVFVAAAVVALVWRIFTSPRRWRFAAALLGILAVVVAVRLCDPRSTRGTVLTSKEQEILNRLGPDLNVTLRQMAFENAPDLFLNTTPRAVMGNKFGVPPLDLALSATIFISGIMLVRRRVLWGMVVALFMVQWLLFLPDVRYFLPILPLLAYGWWLTVVWLDRAIRQPWGGRVFIALMFLWVGANVSKTMGVLIAQRGVPFYATYQRGLYEGVEELGRRIGRELPADAQVVAPYLVRVQVSFYAERRLYSVAEAERGELPPGPLFVIEPCDAAFESWVKARGWTFGREVLRVERRNGKKPWRILAVGG